MESSEQVTYRKELYLIVHIEAQCQWGGDQWSASNSDDIVWWFINILDYATGLDCIHFSDVTFNTCYIISHLPVSNGKYQFQFTCLLKPIQYYLQSSGFCNFYSQMNINSYLLIVKRVIYCIYIYILLLYNTFQIEKFTTANQALWYSYRNTYIYNEQIVSILDTEVVYMSVLLSAKAEVHVYLLAYWL